MQGWQEWYAALPGGIAGAEQSLGLFQRLETAAHYLEQTQVTLASAMSQVPVVCQYGMQRVNRSLVRQPELNRVFNDMTGYQKGLLKASDLETLRFLVLDRKVDPHYQEDGYNALSGVAQGLTNEVVHPGDQIARIRFLLQYRVDVNSVATEHGNNTPLHFLIEHQHEAVALFFIRYARETKQRIDFHRTNVEGKTPLLLAITLQKVEVIDAILDEMQKHDADVGLNQCDIQGQSALDYARDLGLSRIIVRLLALGAGQQGDKMPLHRLIANRDTDLILFVLNYATEYQHPMPLDLQDEQGNTPLLLAIKTLQLEIVRAMLRHIEKFSRNMVLDVQDTEQRTALDCSVILGQDEMVQALVALKAKPHVIQNNFSNLALFNASVIESLLQSVNIDPHENTENTLGHTRPLYQQCLRGQTKIKLLFPQLYKGFLLVPLPPWKKPDLGVLDRYDSKKPEDDANQTRKSPR